ncbi:hypothetical protein HAX54_006994 [Datura stramonium]|uniref:Uncharacterized protein n=1 Tax=Datura stramonium TaxID=4076 RepID=A0ABS8WXK4_DATST|nr:hypothetical protein [Datura stramonium]
MKKFLELRRKLRAHIGHGLGTKIELYEIESPVVPHCMFDPRPSSPCPASICVVKDAFSICGLAAIIGITFFPLSLALVIIELPKVAILVFLDLSQPLLNPFPW